MKYMLSWKIRPDAYKSVVSAFLAGGAPVPSGITLVGRWHAPGTSYGWLLVEGDIEAVAEHGGMGQVYQATDTKLNRQSDSDQHRLTFRRES